MDKLSNKAIEEMSLEVLQATVRDLRNLAMVQDATLYVLIAIAGGHQAIHPIAHSQVDCCIDAYFEVTGDPSLVRPFPPKFPTQDRP